jgi:hypothetical protein
VENCKTTTTTNSRNCRAVRMFGEVWRCVEVGKSGTGVFLFLCLCYRVVEISFLILATRTDLF